MGFVKKAFGALGIVFASAALIRSNELRSSPEISDAGSFDKTIMTFNNSWKKFDLQHEDQMTNAMFNAFYISDEDRNFDKTAQFSKLVFGVDLDSQKLTKTQSQEKLYNLFAKNPFGVEGHNYKESEMRGYYYYTIYKSAGNLSKVNEIALEALSTRDLAKKAAYVGIEAIQPQLDKLKLIGNAAYCFNVSAIIKSHGMDDAIKSNQNVSADEMASYFYEKINTSFGGETEILVKQHNHKEIINDPNLGIWMQVCADQAKIALGH